MSRIRDLLQCTVIISLAIRMGGGDLEPTFSRCCSLGSTWASGGLRCNQFPAPVEGIPADQQTTCITAADICCIKTHREVQCREGKNSARQGQPCQVVSKLGGEYHKDCCEACKLGILSGSMGHGCQFSKSVFGYPWDPAIEACCLETAQSTSSSVTTLPSSSARSSWVISTPALPSLCDLLPGELCNHICVSVPDSYRCECRPGFTLMSDGKTCEPLDRCETDNPCDHNCVDNGGDSIECSCRPGFKIGADKRSCNGPQATNNIDVEPKRCPVGYEFNFQSQVCDDIDECLVNRTICGLNFECQNTIASYTCVRIEKEGCPEGYRMHTGSKNCQDINECAEALDSCNRDRQFCLNTDGSYECQDRLKKSQCPAGYKFNPALTKCEDINECEERIYVCNLESESCINEPGGYRCGKVGLTDTSTQVTCQAGYVLHPQLNSCIDVDECTESGDSACDSSQNCKNTPGSYLCTCKVGFDVDRVTQACADINECQVNQHDCLPSQRCDNTIGSFQCIRFTSCGTGYTLNSQSGQCEDDDECILGTDTCRFQGPIWQCRNTLGSFRCERKRCEGNQRLNSAGECYGPGLTTTTIYTIRTSLAPATTTTAVIACPPGFELSQQNQCIDINECERSNPCKRNQRCYNTVGSHRCINMLNCNGGFKLNDDGTKCVDVDECTTSTHDCSRTQICQNLPGGYICQCPAGHTLNSAKECVDVDECTRYAGQVCAIASICQNTPGSYRCVCKDGFRQGIDNKSCEDVDECKETPGLCHQTCINMWGSYRCVCEQGFSLNSDNRSCSDFDECSHFKDRNLCIGVCVNQPGSYSCQCPQGYRLGADGRTCQDTDECQSGNACRSPNEICLNTRGSYRCNTINCPPNFVKDTEHKNRCKRESPYCREGDQACLKLPMSYSFNFITFVSNLAIPPSGTLDLFTMRGPHHVATRTNFNLEMLHVHSPIGVQTISKNYFRLRNTAFNQAVISLVKSIPGPQEIELQLSMDLHHSGVYGGSAVAKLFIYVSQYEY